MLGKNIGFQKLWISIVFLLGCVSMAPTCFNRTFLYVIAGLYYGFENEFGWSSYWFYCKGFLALIVNFLLSSITRPIFIVLGRILHISVPLVKL